MSKSPSFEQLHRDHEFYSDMLMILEVEEKTGTEEWLRYSHRLDDSCAAIERVWNALDRTPGLSEQEIERLIANRLS